MPEVKFYPTFDISKFSDVKPARSINFMPDWYKDQPHQEGGGDTIKRCMPVFDSMSAGYIFVVPVDIYVDATNPDYIFAKLNDPKLEEYNNAILTNHGYNQYQRYPIDTNLYHKHILRINPGWAIETPEGYSTLFTQPVHRHPTPLFGLSGIIDTDTFISIGFLSFQVVKGFKGVIGRGTPLIQMIPFLREDWDSKWTSTFIPEQKSKGILNKQYEFVKKGKVGHVYRDLLRKVKRW